MAKPKTRKQSAKALLASIAKEMAEPRMARSARAKIGKQTKGKPAKSRPKQ